MDEPEHSRTKTIRKGKVFGLGSGLHHRAEPAMTHETWTKAMDTRLEELVRGRRFSYDKIGKMISAQFAVDISKGAAIGRAYRIGVGPRRKSQRRGIPKPRKRHELPADQSGPDLPPEDPPAPRRPLRVAAAEPVTFAE